MPLTLITTPRIGITHAMSDAMPKPKGTKAVLLDVDCIGWPVGCGEGYVLLTGGCCNGACGAGVAGLGA